METRMSNDANVGWRFWIAWVLGSSLAWLVSFIVTFILMAVVVEAVWGDPETAGVPFTPFLTLAFSMGGIGTGTGQWLLLRKHLDRAGWWILANGLAFASLPILYAVLEDRVSVVANVIIHSSGAGVLGGTVQWLVLRRNLDRSGWWILASLTIFLVGGGISDLLQAVIGLDGSTSGFVAVASMATISGAAIIVLLRKAGPGTRMAAAIA